MNPIRIMFCFKFRRRPSDGGAEGRRDGGTGRIASFSWGLALQSPGGAGLVKLLLNNFGQIACWPTSALASRNLRGRRTPPQSHSQES
jgi:hypothetical protein